LLTASLLLIGCTNSKLIISPLYNRLDNQARDRFNELGDFDADQKAAFEQAIGTFHVWHRQNEMPQYASLIQEFASSIKTPGQTSREDVNAWADRIEGFAKSARECHPANFMVDSLQTLSDEQVALIEEHFEEEREENRERRKNRTREGRIERRLENTVKWAGRIGWDFTQVQKDIVRAGLVKQPSMREKNVALMGDWTDTLFVLAKNQESPSYKQDMSSHIDKLWTLVEKTHPDEWHEIRDIWKNTSFTLITSMSTAQRNAVSQWMAKMGRTVNSISKDTPSFKVGTDPEVGCLVPVNN